MGSKYLNKFTNRTYKSKVVHAQEAHECIRPVSLDITIDDIGWEMGNKLYDMIYKRTLACFMPTFKQDVYLYVLKNNKDIFKFSLKKNNDPGYKVVYTSDFPDDSILISKIVNNENYNPNSINALEKYTKPKSRFTEASLVKELEKLGIGRPSTFSTIVNTIIKRNYVEKQVKNTTKKVKLLEISIKELDKLDEKNIEANAPNQKGKLFPTNLGELVNEFLVKHFNKINSYSFTSEINDKLDLISNGSVIWHTLVDEVYKSFIDKVNTLGKDANIQITKNTIYKDTKLFENDGYNYSAFKDKYGVCLIRKKGDEVSKVRLDKSADIKSIDLEMALEYFKYPINKGKYKGEDVLLKKGPYGLYCKIGDKNLSISKEDITIEEIIKLIDEKNKKVIKEWKNVKILNGPYGPYIQKGNKRVPVPKDKVPQKLTAKECCEIVKNYKPKKYKKFKKKNT